MCLWVLCVLSNSRNAFCHNSSGYIDLTSRISHKTHRLQQGIVDPKYWGVEKHRLGFSGSARSTPPSTLGWVVSSVMVNSRLWKGAWLATQCQTATQTANYATEMEKSADDNGWNNGYKSQWWQSSKESRNRRNKSILHATMSNTRWRFDS